MWSPPPRLMFSLSVLSLVRIIAMLRLTRLYPSHSREYIDDRISRYRLLLISFCRYKVDRQRSVQVLQTFLSEKEDKLAVEVAWLSTARIDCVLSDSAFLAWCVFSCCELQDGCMYGPW
jgi:hypothetical protein